MPKQQQKNGVQLFGAPKPNLGALSSSIQLVESDREQKRRKREQDARAAQSELRGAMGDTANEAARRRALAESDSRELARQDFEMVKLREQNRMNREAADIEWRRKQQLLSQEVDRDTYEAERERRFKTRQAREEARLKVRVDRQQKATPSWYERAQDENADADREIKAADSLVERGLKRSQTKENRIRAAKMNVESRKFRLGEMMKVAKSRVFAKMVTDESLFTEPGGAPGTRGRFDASEAMRNMQGMAPGMGIDMNRFTGLAEDLLKALSEAAGQSGYDVGSQQGADYQRAMASNPSNKNYFARAAEDGQGDPNAQASNAPAMLGEESLKGLGDLLRNTGQNLAATQLDALSQANQMGSPLEVQMAPGGRLKVMSQDPSYQGPLAGVNDALAAVAARGEDGDEIVMRNISDFTSKIYGGTPGAQPGGGTQPSQYRTGNEPGALKQGEQLSNENINANQPKPKPGRQGGQRNTTVTPAPGSSVQPPAAQPAPSAPPAMQAPAAQSPNAPAVGQVNVQAAMPANPFLNHYAETMRFMRPGANPPRPTAPGVTIPMEEAAPNWKAPKPSFPGAIR